MEFRLRFQTEALAALLGQQVPEGALAAPETQRDTTERRSPGRPRAVRRQQLRRSEDGQWFQVEPLPTDHSCGFHGLEISREQAAILLLEHSDDPEVQDFIAADLAAALQTNERESFPSQIRNDEKLWGALDAYYAAQQGLDEQCREGRDLIAELEGFDALAGASGVDLQEATRRAVHKLFDQLKSHAAGLPSGPVQLRVMQRLGRCKALIRAMEGAGENISQAHQNLRRHCRAESDTFVRWVGADHSFWLSFVRGCGSDRGGGLLDALAKVRRLTVRVWSEGTVLSGTGDPYLELVHEAPFGGRVVNLWLQGERGHFDRLVPYKGDR